MISLCSLSTPSGLLDRPRKSHTARAAGCPPVARHLPSLKGQEPLDSSTSQQTTPTSPSPRRNHGHEYGGRKDARAYAAFFSPGLRANHNSNAGRLDREPDDMQAIGGERRSEALRQGMRKCAKHSAEGHCMLIAPCYRLARYSRKSQTYNRWYVPCPLFSNAATHSCLEMPRHSVR